MQTQEMERNKKSNERRRREEILAMLRKNQPLTLVVRGRENDGDDIVAAAMVIVLGEELGINIKEIRQAFKMDGSLEENLQKGILPIGILTKGSEKTNPFVRVPGTGDLSITEKVWRLFKSPRGMQLLANEMTAFAHQPKHTNGLPQLRKIGKYYKKCGISVEEAVKAMTIILKGYEREQWDYFVGAYREIKESLNNIREKDFSGIRLRIFYKVTTNERVPSRALSHKSPITPPPDVVVVKNPETNHLAVLAKGYVNLLPIAVALRKTISNRIDISQLEAFMGSGLNQGVYHRQIERGEQILIGSPSFLEHPGIPLSIEEILKIVMDNIDIHVEKIPKRDSENPPNREKAEEKTSNIVRERGPQRRKLTPSVERKK